MGSSFSKVADFNLRIFDGLSGVFNRKENVWRKSRKPGVKYESLFGKDKTPMFTISNSIVNVNLNILLFSLFFCLAVQEVFVSRRETKLISF